MLFFISNMRCKSYDQQRNERSGCRRHDLPEQAHLIPAPGLVDTMDAHAGTTGNAVAEMMIPAPVATSLCVIWFIFFILLLEIQRYYTAQGKIALQAESLHKLNIFNQ